MGNNNATCTNKKLELNRMRAVLRLVQETFSYLNLFMRKKQETGGM